ncbi:MAG: DUF3842 family protein [Sporomusaceae bacterium]|nr:DUF3842 family protein [Sporomusaceae bacterium]
MVIAIIDGMGGGLGVQLVTQLKNHKLSDVEIIALGTNALATNNMVKAGAQRGATGENAIAVSVKRADIVAGPIGIVIADALMGEITPRIAAAVAAVDARKILVPVNQNHFEIAGLETRPMTYWIKEAANRIVALCQ